MRIRFGLAILAIALATGWAAAAPATATAPAQAGASTDVMIADFEATQTPWQSNPADLRVSVVATEPGDGNQLGPRGKALRIDGQARGFVYSAKGTVPDRISDAAELSMWIKRGAAPVTVELQLLEADGNSKFWRRVDLQGEGWQKVDVPLRYMRWGGNRTPAWSRVSRVGIVLRAPGEVWIDEVKLRFTPDATASLTTKQLAAIAFPDAPADTVRSAEWPGGRVLTNAPQLDLKAMEAHLKKVTETLRADLPFLPQPKGFIPTLIVFADDAQYRQFAPRWAKLHDAQMDPPTSGGFTFMSLATGAWNEKFGNLRPTFTHEFVHAYVECAAGLSSGSGDWLHEGLATHYQLVFHPQEGFAQIVTTGLARPNANLPLAKLTSGQRVPLDRYWQARTVVQTLLSKAYRDKLGAAFEAINKTGSSDLSKLMESVWATKLADFEKDWRALCEKEYGK